MCKTERSQSHDAMYAGISLTIITYFMHYFAQFEMPVATSHVMMYTYMYTHFSELDCDASNSYITDL